MDAAVGVVQGGLLLLGGLVMAFRGRRMFRVLLPAMGFVVFGLATMALARPHAGADVAVVWAMGLVGGVMGAVFSMAAYVYGLFMVGFAFGGHVGALFAHRIASDASTAMLLVGVLGGLGALAAERPLVILATSLWGAMFAVTGYLILSGSVAAARLAEPGMLLTLGQHARALPMAWAVLALLGVAVQARGDGRTVVVR